METEVGVGSRFSFAVPLIPVGAGAVAITAAEPCRPKETGGAKTILLVEDDKFSMKLLKAILEGVGYEVEACDNGEVAIGVLNSKKFDLIVMDIQLPKLNGLDATTKIRSGQVPRCNPHIPILAVTAFAVRGDRERFLEAGADDYISKPIDRDTLLASVKRLLDPGNGPVAPLSAH